MSPDYRIYLSPGATQCPDPKGYDFHPEENIPINSSGPSTVTLEGPINFEVGVTARSLPYCTPKLLPPSPPPAPLEPPLTVLQTCDKLDAEGNILRRNCFHISLGPEIGWGKIPDGRSYFYTGGMFSLFLDQNRLQSSRIPNYWSLFLEAGLAETTKISTSTLYGPPKTTTGEPSHYTVKDPDKSVSPAPLETVPGETYCPQGIPHPLIHPTECIIPGEERTLTIPAQSVTTIPVTKAENVFHQNLVRIALGPEVGFYFKRMGNNRLNLLGSLKAGPVFLVDLEKASLNTVMGAIGAQIEASLRISIFRLEPKGAFNILFNRDGLGIEAILGGNFSFHLSTKDKTDPTKAIEIRKKQQEEAEEAQKRKEIEAKKKQEEEEKKRAEEEKQKICNRYPKDFFNSKAGEDFLLKLKPEDLISLRDQLRHDFWQATRLVAVDYFDRKIKEMDKLDIAKPQGINLFYIRLAEKAISFYTDDKEFLEERKKLLLELQKAKDSNADKSLIGAIQDKLATNGDSFQIALEEYLRENQLLESAPSFAALFQKKLDQSFIDGNFQTLSSFNPVKIASALKADDTDENSEAKYKYYMALGRYHRMEKLRALFAQDQYPGVQAVRELYRQFVYADIGNLNRKALKPNSNLIEARCFKVVYDQLKISRSSPAFHLISEDFKDPHLFPPLEKGKVPFRIKQPDACANNSNYAQPKTKKTPVAKKRKGIGEVIQLNPQLISENKSSLSPMENLAQGEYNLLQLAEYIKNDAKKIYVQGVSHQTGIHDGEIEPGKAGELLIEFHEGEPRFVKDLMQQYFPQGLPEELSTTQKTVIAKVSPAIVYAYFYPKAHLVFSSEEKLKKQIEEAMERLKINKTDKGKAQKTIQEYALDAMRAGVLAEVSQDTSLKEGPIYLSYANPDRFKELTETEKLPISYSSVDFPQATQCLTSFVTKEGDNSLLNFQALTNPVYLSPELDRLGLIRHTQKIDQEIKKNKQLLTVPYQRERLKDFEIAMLERIPPNENARLLPKDLGSLKSSEARLKALSNIDLDNPSTLFETFYQANLLIGEEKERKQFFYEIIRSSNLKGIDEADLNRAVYGDNDLIDAIRKKLATYH